MTTREAATTGNGKRDVVRLATDHQGDVMPRMAPLATDRLLDPVLSHLTGSDLVLSGRRTDGTAYHDRMLTNVSFAPTRSGRIMATGLEPGVGVRQFCLSGVDLMAVVGPGTERRTFSSEELAGLLDRMDGK